MSDGKFWVSQPRFRYRAARFVSASLGVLLCLPIEIISAQDANTIRTECDNAVRILRANPEKGCLDLPSLLGHLQDLKRIAGISNDPSAPDILRAINECQPKLL